MSYSQRNADWVISKAYVHAQRKGTAPAVGTDKYAVLLDIADSMQQMWAAEPGIEWNSLYSIVSNGVITATDTFDLDDSVDYISKRFGDYVTTVSANGLNIVTYKLVSPDQLYEYKADKAVAQIGRTLKFSKPFISTDTEIGYTLKVPAMTFPDDLTSGSSLVSVDDPMWLVYMTAAEYVRNDVVKVSQYNNLLAMADNSLQKMKANNGGQYDSVPLAMTVNGETWL
jgi:hypothetical protein